jgi:hypothetical protein
MPVRLDVPRVPHLGSALTLCLPIRYPAGPSADDMRDGGTVSRFSSFQAAGVRPYVAAFSPLSVDGFGGMNHP